MFKFVAICALLAAASASPSTFISTPLAYSTGLAPAVTAYSPAASVYSAAPLVYSSPLHYSANYDYVHLIKKRSASPSPQFAYSSYYPGAAYPAYSTYSSYGAPIATSYVSGPGAYHATSFVQPAPVFPAAHLIKKRSAPLLVSPSYVAPAAYSAPLVSSYSTYPAAAPIYSTPYYSAGPYSGPFAYTQYIKK